MNANAYCENDILYIKGEVNFSTVNQLWKDSIPLLTEQSIFKIDLSKVTFANSASIALLLEWLKYANQLKKQIVFSGIPEQMKLLVVVSGINNIIPSF